MTRTITRCFIFAFALIVGGMRTVAAQSPCTQDGSGRSLGAVWGVDPDTFGEVYFDNFRTWSGN